MMEVWSSKTASVWLAVVLVVLLAGSVSAAAPQQKTMRAYHIGNSLVRSLTPDRLHELMAERGIDYQFGSQLLGGCSLARHWLTREKGEWTRNWESNKPAGDAFEPGEPDSDPHPKRFGPYGEALVQHKWDALVLQPMGGGANEMQAIRDFINFALEHGATTRFYIYQTWGSRPPLRDASGQRIGGQSIDYQALWERPYPPADAEDTGGRRGRYWCRGVYQKLMEEVNAEFADKLDNPVWIVPAGEVFCELDKRLKAGQIPGLAELYARNPERIPGWDPESGAKAGANILYADSIHPNPRPHLSGNISNYAVGLTHFAALTGQSPIGLSGKVYGLDDGKDAALIKALQQAVWHVVSKHPHSGVR